MLLLFSSHPPGEMIITNDRYLMTETENSMYAVQMTLVIRKLQKSDMGGYKCISKNSIGDAEGTIRLYGELVSRANPLQTGKRWSGSECLCFDVVKVELLWQSAGRKN